MYSFSVSVEVCLESKDSGKGELPTADELLVDKGCGVENLRLVMNQFTAPGRGGKTCKQVSVAN